MYEPKYHTYLQQQFSKIYNQSDEAKPLAKLYGAELNKSF